MQRVLKKLTDWELRLAADTQKTFIEMQGLKSRLLTREKQHVAQKVELAELKRAIVLLQEGKILAATPPPEKS